MTELAAATFLKALKTLGVDYFIANPGTDFPPIVEAYCACADEPDVLPRPVLATHETIAAAMGHGVYLASGRPAAVMLHVNVGTANAICNLVNAQRDHIPLLLLAGRTPFMETGPHGSRSSIIHWGQEMFDQGGMLREIVKWDYEWKMPEQAGVLARRSIAIAMAHPRGPVYLTMPREVIAHRGEGAAVSTLGASPAAVVAQATIEAVADRLRQAKAPLIVTSAAGRDQACVPALVRLAQAGAVPVIEHAMRHMNFPQDNPWHAGFDPAQALRTADLVIVLESEVPWIPSKTGPRDDAFVIHMATDPLFQRYPIRSFRSDLDIAGNMADAVGRLADVLEKRGTDERRAEPAPVVVRNEAKPHPAVAITAEAASAAIEDILDDDTVVFNEYPLQRAHCRFTRPGSYFGHSPAGGLGWGLGAALGYKLAAPEKFVVATLGDGAYIFANPVAGHIVSAAEDLPILVIVFDNKRYNAVRRSTLGMYAQGASAADDGMFLAKLEATPDYADIARAHGAHAETVEIRESLPAALRRAKEAVLNGRQALVNIRIAG